jgi:polysaccharide export outer membrane protein
MRRILEFFAIVCLLVACSDASINFPTKQPLQEKMVAQTSVKIRQIDTKTLASFSTQQDGPKATSLPSITPIEYRIGVGDMLSIHVFDQPELVVPSSQAALGFLVQADGTLAYPFLKSVPAAGRTVEDLRRDMTLGLSKFFTDPQIDIRISDFKSQRVVVGGEVLHPGTLSLSTNPMTLLEALNGAGGLAPDADPAHATACNASRRRPGRPPHMQMIH